jgi:FkbM family methyltransferase
MGVDRSITATQIYDAYQYLFHHQQWKHNRRMKAFYANLVGSVPLAEWGLERRVIFDVGANRGDTADYFRHCADEVVCIEPDHRSAGDLRERFGAIRHVTIVEGAVSAQNGFGLLHVNPEQPAYNTLHPGWKAFLEDEAEMTFNQTYVVETFTLDHLMSVHGEPLFIKLDVEGFEIEALKGLNRPVPYLSFESNLNVFRDDCIRCVRRLQSVSPHVDFLFSESEGFRKRLSPWMSGEDLIRFIRSTDIPFVEVLARMQRLDPRETVEVDLAETIPMET